MKTRLRFFIALITLFIIANTSFAETPDEPKDKILEPGFRLLLLGPYGGVNFNFHRGQFRTTDGNYLCCEFNEGKGIGLVAGIKAFIPITEALHVVPRLAYESFGGEFTEQINDIPMRGAGNQLEYWNVEEKLKVTLNVFNVDVLGAYTLTSFGLYIAAGPAAHFTMKKEFKTTETILGPPGVRYLDGSTTKEFLKQETAVRDMLFSLRGGVGALIPLTQSIYINPEALYSFPLTTVSKEGEWKASAIQATLGILFLL